VAESDGLENRCGCTPTVGSNPTPSAGWRRPGGPARPGLVLGRVAARAGASRPGTSAGPGAGQKTASLAMFALGPGLDRRG
jgi:hypothetical protein